jgi:Xaa-Pro aminopeptidase
VADNRLLIREKLEQATGVLNELDMDAWILVARESDTLGDPSLPLVVGTNVTWPSAFIVRRDGKHRAIVATGDVANVRQTGAWDDVVGYVESLGPPLLEALEEFDPQTIALNYSTDNTMADGLTFGMYLELQRFIGKTPYWDRITSGEPVVSRVRGRKSAEELRRIRAAIATTETIWDELKAWLRPGVSELDVYDFMHERLRAHGVGPAWYGPYCPIVDAGPGSPEGHVGATDMELKRGNLVVVDFGVTQDDYTSDMQRNFYLLRDGETKPPAEVVEAFEVVADAIQAGAAALKPGVPGWEVDQAARNVLERHGAETWNYGFGHQMGRACHDGGAMLSPRWDRYGQRPYDLIEESQVYTLEIGFPVEGYGRVQLEEDAVVTSNGCELLTNAQRELILIG